jgi:hypothetical protein
MFERYFKEQLSPWTEQDLTESLLFRSPFFFVRATQRVGAMKSKAKHEMQNTSEGVDTVTFLLRIPKDLWQRFIKTVPISRTRHEFLLDLIQRRVWEYEKASETV